MKSLLKFLPWFFVALFGVEILVVMLPKKDGEYHVREFGRLPVFYFPLEDVRMDVMEATDRRSHSPLKGEASY